MHRVKGKGGAKRGELESRVYIPSRHEAVGEEEGQVAAGEALEYPQRSSISFLYPNNLPVPRVLSKYAPK